MCNLLWYYTVCTGVTLFCNVLHFNCTAVSQSESSNFFMHIIFTTVEYYKLITRVKFPPWSESALWCKFDLHQVGWYLGNNIRTKISAFWLAKSMSINPTQWKNLKFFECRKTKLVQKVEIKNDWQVPWKTVAKKQNGGQVCWEQQHLNSKFKG